MRLPVLLAAASVLASLGSAACGRQGLPPSDTDSTVVTSTAPPAPAALALSAGGVVTSADAAGRPRFIRAVGGPAIAVAAVSPEAAAREHVARFAPAYGLAPADAARVEPARTGRTPRGDYLVRMRQQVDGIEVYRGEVKVVMRSDLSLLALSGTPSDVAGVKPADAAFPLTPGEALQMALQDLYGGTVPAGTAAARVTQDPGEPGRRDVWLDLPPGSAVHLSEPARARPVYYRLQGTGDAKLIAAYFIEFYASSEQATTSDAYRYLIAAQDGRVLERRNLTADAAFRYRVFADASGDFRPLDGPMADFTPHPVGLPDGSFPAYVAPALVSIESLKSKPPMAIDPWLSANAAQTLGNNVDAYADLFAPDGYSNGDLRATVTAPGTFDRVYDTSLDPGASTTQTMAATTNLFFLVNWLHDYWYDSGFDEVAGNAQTSNFGRGGAGADAIRAEAQDSGGLNNANMATPSDGLSPRMQMYSWTAQTDSALTIEPGPLALDHGFAAFGPQTFDVTGDVVLAADGTAPPGDACQPLTNDVAGRIVLLDRGLCGFSAKALAAEAAGAIGVILANNVPGAAPGLGNPIPPVAVAIPTLSVSLDDGNRLKALLAGEGAVLRARLYRAVVGPGRDGSLDNMIVAHEWGHYFHHRLTDCGSTQCGAMSEGWGDFIALHTALREGDNLDGTYGAGIYGPRSLSADSGYFGIRRFAYSADFSKNGLTFKHIQDGVPLPPGPSDPFGPNSESHNAGEVWCSMVFESYVGLQKNAAGRSFAAVRRAFSDYLVLGLQLAPPNASFTETRDAILTAISMINPADLGTVAEAFARRGAGTCAVGPSADAMAPVTEAFTVQPRLALTSILIDDTVKSCDGDGILDAGEIGRVQVAVANQGPIALAGTTVTLTTTTPGVVFPEGATRTIPAIAAYAGHTLDIPIAVEASVTDVAVLALTVTVANDAACTPSLTEVRNPRINADEKPETSATDDVEAVASPWARAGTGADGVWSRVALAPGSHAWQGANIGTASDTQLVSPALRVGAGPFQVAFDHAYSFELSDETYWDGGVIEISSDDGATWQDVSALVDPGYTGTLTNLGGNPLTGRRAFGGASAGFPALARLTLDFGSAFAGKTVRIRFRIGTDLSVAAPGWTIDNIAVQGIENLPFTTVVAHAGLCQVPPIASAGRDRTVANGADVLLDASASRDPNGDPMTFQWTQTAGPAVTILNPTAVVAAFRAPAVNRDRTLTFQVQVSDAGGSSTDRVTIKVRKRNHFLGEGGDDPSSVTAPVSVGPTIE